MIPFPDKKYNIIYADPPWKYWAGGNKNATRHYNCMEIDDIKDLPVNNIAEDDSVLCMWVTYPILPEALELIKSWGFEYSTGLFTWVKKNKKADSWFWGCGNYTRANAEFVLLARKGKGVQRVSRSVHQVCDARIMEHSKKPQEIRDRIVELFGDLPRIELFARQKTEGWDVWGNEI